MYFNMAQLYKCAQYVISRTGLLLIVLSTCSRFTSNSLKMTNNASNLHMEFSPALSTSLDKNIDQQYGFYIENCSSVQTTVSSVKNLFDEFNATTYLHVIKCNNPLSFLEQVSSKKLWSGDGTVIMVSSSSLVSLIVPDKIAGSSIFNIDLINLNDHLLLYQKSVTPNFAGQFLTDLFTQWGWRHVHFYIDEYYAGDFLSNVEEFNQQSQNYLQISQLSLVERVSPEEFVNELVTDVASGLRSIVIVANLSITLQVLQWAFPTELMSGRQQWLIFCNEEPSFLHNIIQMKTDTQLYIARHSGTFNELRLLMTEYLQLKPPFEDFITNSSLLFAMNSMDDKPSWRTVMTTMLKLEIRKVLMTSDTNVTSTLVAIWTPSGSLAKIPEPPFPNYHMRSLLVATMDSPPYVIVQSVDEDRSNLSYSGYMVDVLEVVAHVLNFSIEYMEVDISLKSHVTNLSINGVVETLARKEADIGLLDLAITASRMQEIDFAEVALDVQATAGLYRRQGAEGDGIDKFGVYLEPFHYHVWIASIITVILLVTSLYVSLRLTERFSTMGGIEWENDNLNVSRSFLLGFQAVAQQGSELDFGNPSARIFFVILWIFALIAYSSYSATLMSYLTFSKIPSPFTNLATLSKNKEYGIGVLDGSSQIDLFRESRSPVYHAIWNRILTDKKSMTLTSMEQAFKKSTKEKFVYLSDDKIMKYWTRNTCDLVVSEPLTSSNLVTLTFQKSSPHRKAVSRVLRMMNDGGLLYRLRDKWWGTALICKMEAQAFISLSLMNVATGFLLLAGGIVGGTLGLILEWLIFRGGRGQKKKIIQMEKFQKNHSPKQFSNRILKLAFVPDYDPNPSPKHHSQRQVTLKSSSVSLKPPVF